MKKIVFLTGGSSGIGLETAKALSRAGCCVYEMSRRPFSSETVHHLTGDVTSPEQITTAVQQIIAREGRINILINNAGFGISGAAEFTAAEAAKRQMDVNFLGYANVCNAVLPIMRAAGGGRIVNLSSVAAAAPIPFQAFYSASKAAVNAYTLALANEVRPFGVSVCAVMPGDIKTGFTAAREKEPDGDTIYGGRIFRSVEKMEKDEQNGMDPAKAGAYIAKIALKKSVKPLYVLRTDYKLIVLLTRFLPVRLLNAVIGRLYAR